MPFFFNIIQFFLNLVHIAWEVTPFLNLDWATYGACSDVFLSADEEIRLE